MLVNHANMDPRTMSIGAVNIGNTVMAMKYKDGVLVASDTVISYGGFKDFKDKKRIFNLTNSTVIAASGEMSDFQEVYKMLTKKATNDFI